MATRAASTAAGARSREQHLQHHRPADRRADKQVREAGRQAGRETNRQAVRPIALAYKMYDADCQPVEAWVSGGSCGLQQGAVMQLWQLQTHANAGCNQPLAMTRRGQHAVVHPQDSLLDLSLASKQVSANTVRMPLPQGTPMPSTTHNFTKCA